MTGKIAILDHCSALKDPRQSWKVVYPLPEIMLLILAATIAGADDFVEIEEWGNKHLDFLRKFLPYERGIPSHDALNDLVNALDPKLFKACFTSWVETLREDDPDIIAVDGKTSRRTHNCARGRELLHLVSAWATRQRLVLGQQAIDAKSNEIKAIPLLLERLALKGALVTIDAMGTQTEIAQTIIDKGGDYCLALKENRPVLYGDVEASSPTLRRVPSPPSRPPTATMAGWRRGCTASATTSPRCSRTGAMRASRRFPVLP